jgi:hypothetical protein
VLEPSDVGSHRDLLVPQSVDAPCAGLTPRCYWRKWEAFASLPVVAAAQRRREEWPVAALDCAEAPAVELALVMQRAQPSALAELLSVTAGNHAYRPGESLLSPMCLTEPFGVRSVRAALDAAVGAAAQELAVVASAETAALGLAIASRLSTDNASESSFVVVSSAQLAVVRAVAAPRNDAPLRVPAPNVVPA